jgi:hypothetical protein
LKKTKDGKKDRNSGAEGAGYLLRNDVLVLLVPVGSNPASTKLNVCTRRRDREDQIFTIYTRSMILVIRIRGTCTVTFMSAARARILIPSATQPTERKKR